MPFLKKIFGIINELFTVKSIDITGVAKQKSEAQSLASPFQHTLSTKDYADNQDNPVVLNGLLTHKETDSAKNNVKGVTSDGYFVFTARGLHGFSQYRKNPDKTLTHIGDYDDGNYQADDIFVDGSGILWGAFMGRGIAKLSYDETGLTHIANYANTEADSIYVIDGDGKYLYTGGAGGGGGSYLFCHDYSSRVPVE